jgi:hypothetical protein
MTITVWRVVKLCALLESHLHFGGNVAPSLGQNSSTLKMEEAVPPKRQYRSVTLHDVTS